MVMPAIRGFVLFMLVNGNSAAVFMMVVRIDADLCRAMRRIVNRPRRNRNAHAKCQPHKDK